MPIEFEATLNLLENMHSTTYHVEASRPHIDCQSEMQPPRRIETLKP